MTATRADRPRGGEITQQPRDLLAPERAYGSAMREYLESQQLRDLAAPEKRWEAAWAAWMAGR